MSKAILVMNMPKDCEDCPLFRERENNPHQCEAKHKDVDMYTYYNNRPSWCPLKEVSEKKKADNHYLANPDWEDGFNRGYNTCIEDMTEEWYERH